MSGYWLPVCGFPPPQIKWKIAVWSRETMVSVYQALEIRVGRDSDCSYRGIILA